LSRCGPNRLTCQRQRTLWLQFVAQFHAPLLYPLLITGAVKCLSSSLREAVVFWSVTVPNARSGLLPMRCAARARCCATASPCAWKCRGWCRGMWCCWECHRTRGSGRLAAAGFPSPHATDAEV
jgi:hypothetical protein